MTGRAVDTLDAMIARNEVPFDLIFIDADKESCPQYLERALAPSRKGTLLLVDNVVRRRRQRRAAGDRCARMATARKLRRPSGVSPELTFASGGSHSLGVPARWLPRATCFSTPCSCATLRVCFASGGVTSTSEV